MSIGLAFEEYLLSKKIDSSRFRSEEPDVWKEWQYEFEQMHPNSFTVQKLNLINPVRRKYPLAIVTDENKTSQPPADVRTTAPAAKPGRPIIKPKIN